VAVLGHHITQTRSLLKSLSNIVVDPFLMLPSWLFMRVVPPANPPVFAAYYFFYIESSRSLPPSFLSYCRPCSPISNAGVQDVSSRSNVLSLLRVSLLIPLSLMGQQLLLQACSALSDLMPATVRLYRCVLTDCTHCIRTVYAL
jgi:hypothetical protein